MAQVEEFQNRALEAEHTLEDVKMELLKVHLIIHRCNFNAKSKGIMASLTKIIYTGTALSDAKTGAVAIFILEKSEESISLSDISVFLNFDVTAYSFVWSYSESAR